MWMQRNKWCSVSRLYSSPPEEKLKKGPGVETTDIEPTWCFKEKHLMLFAKIKTTCILKLYKLQPYWKKRDGGFIDRGRGGRATNKSTQQISQVTTWVFSENNWYYLALLIHTFTLDGMYSKTQISIVTYLTTPKRCLCLSLIPTFYLFIYTNLHLRPLLVMNTYKDILAWMI